MKIGQVNQYSFYGRKRDIMNEEYEKYRQFERKMSTKEEQIKILEAQIKEKDREIAQARRKNIELERQLMFLKTTNS